MWVCACMNESMCPSPSSSAKVDAVLSHVQKGVRVGFFLCVFMCPFVHPCVSLMPQ